MYGPNNQDASTISLYIFGGPRKGLFLSLSQRTTLSSRGNVPQYGENVTIGQMKSEAEMVLPHELVEVAWHHILLWLVHPFKHRFHPLPITFYIIVLAPVTGLTNSCRFNRTRGSLLLSVYLKSANHGSPAPFCSGQWQQAKRYCILPETYTPW